MSKQEENEFQIKTMRRNLRLFREERNWSIEQLSQISKIDAKILVGIENEANFDIEFLFTLCHLYGIRLQKIFLAR